VMCSCLRLSYCLFIGLWKLSAIHAQYGYTLIDRRHELVSSTQIAEMAFCLVFVDHRYQEGRPHQRHKHWILVRLNRVICIVHPR
jgi:hypothetical protein